MATKTSSPETEQYRAERLGVLVALAAQPPAGPAGPHPSAEELAAISEGRLDAASRMRVLTHLDACADCYREWLAGSSACATNRPCSRWWQIVDVPQRRRRRILFWSGASAALAACLILVFLILWRPDSGLPILIEDAYNTVQGTRPPGLWETAARQKLPWEEPAPAYGFSSAASEAAKAFAAGLWQGRAALGDDGLPRPKLPAVLAPPSAKSGALEPWRNTDWADYALLGRWVFLLQTVCRTPQADVPAFWRQQPAIAAATRDHLAQRTATDPLARPVAAIVQQLEAALSDPARVQNRARLCGEIERYFSRLNALLTPPGL